MAELLAKLREVRLSLVAIASDAIDVAVRPNQCCFTVVRVKPAVERTFCIFYRDQARFFWWRAGVARRSNDHPAQAHAATPQRGVRRRTECESRASCDERKAVTHNLIEEYVATAVVTHMRLNQGLTRPRSSLFARDRARRYPVRE